MVIFGRRPQVPRPTAKKPKQSADPLGFFEEKRIWRRSVAKRKFRQGSRLIPGTGSRRYHRHEVDKILDERFKWATHRGFISKEGATRELKNIRREEFRAKTGAEKRKLRGERLFLEREFGFKGRY